MLPLTMDKQPVAGLEGQDGLHASAVYDKDSGEIIVKVVNTSRQQQPIAVNLNGVKGERTAATITLYHDGMDDENTLDRPELIKPMEGTTTLAAGKNAAVLTDQLPPMSFRVYKIKK